MATQSVKVKNDDSQGGIGAGASKIGGQVSGTIQDTREFLHNVRLEMKQVTWPSREEVISTTTLVPGRMFRDAASGARMWVSPPLVRIAE